MMRPTRGFLLLPVVLLLSLVAGTAYLSLREGHLSVLGEQRQEEGDKARAAAEAGLHRLVHEAHLKGCGGDYPTRSKPVTDTNFGGARYSAFASAKEGSPLTLTSEGFFGDAKVSLTRQNVLMHRASVQTLVLQPGPEGQDTSVQRASDSAEPDAPTLTLRPNVSEALMAFDLSQIPAGSHVTAAQLLVRLTDLQGSGSVGVHRIQSEWAESASSTQRLSTQPWVETLGDAHPSAVASAQTPALGWMAWSLPDLVDGWIKGRWPNHGLLLRGIKLQSLSLASGDYPVAGLRPRLVVSFHPPCAWDLPRQTQTLVPAADATLSEGLPTVNDGASGTLKLLNGANDFHTVMQFDTSSIAREKTIRKATLRLTFEGLSGSVPTPKAVQIYARRNIQSWNDSAVTWIARTSSANWTRQGGWVDDEDVVQPRTSTLPKGSSANTVVEFDAREWVAWWTESDSYNQGILLRLPASDGITLPFGSRESLTAPPELVIEYE